MTSAGLRADPAIALVVLSLIVQEAGASVAVLVIPQVGALGIVLLRLLFSAIVLLAIARPRIRGLRGVEWRTVAFFAVSLAAMNALFYEAIGRIPLGTAVTIELLGPLVLSVVLGRRASSWLWAALALGGVVLLGGAEFEHLEPVGVLCAAGAGGFWACYILASRGTGQRFRGVQGLALATAGAALLTLPLGVAAAGATLIDPRWLALGLVIALCSSAIPYALDLIALRRLDAAVFGVLMSLLPAVATLAGVLVLRQPLSWLGAVGIAVVIAASIAAVLTGPRDAPAASEAAA